MDQCKPSRTAADFNLKLQTAQNGVEEVDQRMCGKRLLRYLRGSKCLKLTYTNEASYDLVRESDADWSGDVNDRKSTTGYYFKLN